MKTVIRTDLGTNEKTEISITEAKLKLSGYWNPDKIDDMLFNGTPMHTPYATYELKK